MHTRNLTIAALLVALLALAAAAPPALAQTPGPCTPGTLPSRALSLICVPTQGWNGDLVLYAHGYVAPGRPLDLQHLALPDGTALPQLVQRAGYAFATTSYRQNGLAVLEGVQDLRELRAAFAAAAGAPRRVYAAGVSEGALVVTLLAERYPQEVTGALATCGPIGSFRAQVGYVGDFRVLFDYFFPRVLPGSAIKVPAVVRSRWDRVYRRRIEAAVRRNPRAARQLVRVANAAVDPRDRGTLARTIVNTLWYNAFATNDAVAKLGGNPFHNVRRRYSGSSDDRRLNRAVRRYRADRTALRRLAAYETTGRLQVPLVALHTTRDEVVPYRHQLMYTEKVRIAGRQGLFTPVPIARYGHCNVTAQEVLSAFVGLVNRPVQAVAPSQGTGR